MLSVRKAEVAVQVQQLQSLYCSSTVVLALVVPQPDVVVRSPSIPVEEQLQCSRQTSGTGSHGSAPFLLPPLSSSSRQTHTPEHR